MDHGSMMNGERSNQMAANDLDIKVRKVAKRYQVDRDDLVKKVQINRLEEQGIALDTTSMYEDIKQPSKDLDLAAEEIEEFLRIAQWKRKH
jgi:hypothetical protein